MRVLLSLTVGRNGSAIALLSHRNELRILGFAFGINSEDTLGIDSTLASRSSVSLGIFSAPSGNITRDCFCHLETLLYRSQIEPGSTIIVLFKIVLLDILSCVQFIGWLLYNGFPSISMSDLTDSAPRTTTVESVLSGITRGVGLTMK